jgi:hypothetical protein
MINKIKSADNKLLLVLGYLFFVLTVNLISNQFDFKLFSPDSIRFLHFWQNSFSSDYTQTSFLQNIKDAMNASHNYDLGRGRVVMYALYGLENVLLYFFDKPTQNFLIILVICLNSHAVSILISKHVVHLKFYIYFLSFFIVAINAISLSPSMYFALYAKYICLTFILYFFVLQNKYLKILMLLLAAFTDEVGLILGLLISFFYICRYLLLKDVTRSTNFVFLSKNIFLSGLICLILMGVFFLVLFLTFETLPLQFAKYSARGALWLFDFENLVDRVTKLAWTVEILILGFSFENKMFLSFSGFVSIFALLIFIYIFYKKHSFDWNKDVLKKNLSNINFSSNQSILIFWILATLLLLIIMPSSPFIYQTYSYPLMLSLSLVILLSASMSLKPSTLLKTFTLISLIHLLTIPQSIKSINTSNGNHLLIDGTVSIKDIRNLQNAINDIRTDQYYEKFNNINNRQEIDYSGMWYYSLDEHWRFPYKADGFGNLIEENNYFPIYGTVRVVSWPHFDPEKGGFHQRKFVKNKPIYKD